MNKELEALERIDERNYLTEREHREFYNIVEKALKRLEAIDNAKPSEAIECLKVLEDCADVCGDYSHRVETIRQALIQAEKDKAKIEKLKHDNAILHIQLDTFKKLAFKNKGEQCEKVE